MCFSCHSAPCMEAATGRISVVAFSPSCRPHGGSPSTSTAAGMCGLWLYRRRAHFPLLRAACTLDPDGGDELVDVIGIGSRKYSVIDFCLASPSLSAPRFKFWTIYSRDQKKVQLLERSRSKDEVIINVEFPLSPDSCHPASILLASSGHGLDHIAAIDLLNNIKSVGGLAIAIVLKPFGFEGLRRQKEVNDLVNNLKSCLNFYVVVEADPFIKVEMETLAEALESANNAVILAINTISSMILQKHSMLLSTPEGTVKDVKPAEVLKTMERYGEVKIYHGAGYSVTAAIMHAILHCPFFDANMKDFNGLAIMILTCAGNIGNGDLPQIVPIFRRITGYVADIIFSKLCEPNLEEEVVVTTIMIMGHTEKMISPNRGFFSSLLQNLPSILRFFRVDPTKTGNTSSNSSLGDTFFLSDNEGTSDLDLTEATYPLELIPGEDDFSNLLENVLSRKETYHETIRDAVKQPKTNHVSNNKYSGQNTGEELPIAVMMHGSHHIDPAFHIAELWAKKCFERRTKIDDKLDMFSLQVGVKCSKYSTDYTSYYNHMLAENPDYIKQEISGGITADMSKKNSLLSVRAAMMLEAERENQKCWNPIVEIKYRGGIYRGRCQGGLPDGKGRLTFMDGSFFEGFWKCGKRSGFGTFCYSNGDLYRGPWRDDLMHGKGWLYFHTGDRWFANFFRGKASGEGKFFSNNGSVFYGAFHDGWRHGQCVCIDADGSRWREVWEDGVLLERTPQEADID